jgi:3-hydroxybutyryl-CoA dehydrogenase
MSIDRVGVVGAGFMGSGIAESTAAAGIDVTVFEPEQAPLVRSRAQLETSVARATSRGKMTQEEGESLIGRVAYTTRVEDLDSVDAVVEAVTEDPRVKGTRFQQLDQQLPEAQFLASNTSSIPIAEQFASRIGKRPIRTKDRSGFIVNMLLVPYLMAAVRMYEDGFASREDIDEGMRLGAGHPMGPLTLCDFIGLDVRYAVCQSLYEEFKRPEYAPPPLLKRMVVSGHHGRKAGQGFYKY